MANGDWDWLGPVAGALGVGLGAAGTVMAGGWKFLKGLASSRAEEEIRALRERVLVLETQWKEDREVATRVRQELRETLSDVFEKLGEVAENSAATRALVSELAAQRRR